MKICGFLQNRNGIASGDLRRCLTSMAAVTDKIVVYDDYSDEDVRPLYEAFDCVVVYGHKRAFFRELYHKTQLLSVALRESPDWIVWFDSDAALGAALSKRENMEKMLKYADDTDRVLLGLHNLNLWRSSRYYRTDNSFNDLWHGVFWKNTGELHYRPKAGLHQKQYPFFAKAQEQPLTPTPITDDHAKLLHYGFATDEAIAHKYFTYRDNGQRGWALDRLVNDEGMVLERAPAEWFPADRDDEQTAVMDDDGPPAPLFNPKEMAGYGCFDEWQAAYKERQAENG